jgi:hypothetical protein
MSNIEAYDETTTKTAVRFSLDISQMELSVSATFRVSLYDANDKYISNKYVIIEGQDYTAWGNDDQYVIDFVAQKLGFTLLP